MCSQKSTQLTSTHAHTEAAHHAHGSHGISQATHTTHAAHSTAHATTHSGGSIVCSHGISSAVHTLLGKNKSTSISALFSTDGTKMRSPLRRFAISF
jgi:hypothetical protein